MDETKRNETKHDEMFLTYVGMNNVVVDYEKRRHNFSGSWDRITTSASTVEESFYEDDKPIPVFSYKPTPDKVSTEDFLTCDSTVDEFVEFCARHDVPIFKLEGYDGYTEPTDEAYRTWRVKHGYPVYDLDPCSSGVDGRSEEEYKRESALNGDYDIEDPVKVFFSPRCDKRPRGDDWDEPWHNYNSGPPSDFDYDFHKVFAMHLPNNVALPFESKDPTPTPTF